jgi:hypothetical protein
VGKRSNWLGIAISVTALDAGVTTYYGSVVWKAFSVVIWTKLLLVLLAAIGAVVSPSLHRRLSCAMYR